MLERSPAIFVQTKGKTYMILKLVTIFIVMMIQPAHYYDYVDDYLHDLGQIITKIHLAMKLV
jgi:hypothetical protein